MATCAHCGAALVGSSEERRSGGQAFCSSFCALHADVNESHARATAPRSALSRRRPPTQRILRRGGLLVVSVIVAFVAVVVVSSSGSSVVARGEAQTIGLWTVSVAGVNLHAGAAPVNASAVAVTVALRYHGAGDASPPFAFYVESQHHTRYGIDPAGLPATVTDAIYAGVQPSDAQLDFTVASNDVTGLQLLVVSRASGTTRFALTGS